MLKDNISEIIEDVKNGKMVIILDDEKRENEGDLVSYRSCDSRNN